MSALTDLVDKQIAAYNERDIEGFLACYAPEAQVVQPDGSYLAN